MRDRFYNSGFVIDRDEDLDITIIAPWVGHVHTFGIHFSFIPTAAGNLVITKEPIIGADWNTEILVIDPFQCQEKDFTFLKQVGCRFEDRFNIFYERDGDGVPHVHVEMILESS